MSIQRSGRFKRKQRHFRQRGAGADLPRLAEGPSV